MASPPRSPEQLPEHLSPGTLRAVIRARAQAQAQAHAQASRRSAGATSSISRANAAASPSHTSPLRRRPRTASYREWSSGDSEPEIDMSEEDSSAAEEASPTEPRVTRSSRRRPSSVQRQPIHSRQRQSQRRSSRLAQYAEDSHSDTPVEEESNAAEEDVQPPRAKRQRISNPARADASSRTTRRSKRHPQQPPARRKTVQFQERKSSPKPSVPPVPSDGIIPQWHGLPYEILLTIFRYALFPTHDDDFRPTANVNWLLRASRVCKAFTEPALSALYESPPLLFLDQPHDFLDLLGKQATYLDYRLKVKRLEMDYRRTLAYSLPGRGNLDITALISNLPNLAAIEITSGLDRPPYRQITQKGRWVYPENLFQCLNESGVRLKEWRWAGHMIGKTFPGFHELHLQPQFQSLVHLTISHIWFTDEGDVYKKPKQEMPPLALQPLQNLEHLTLIACDSWRWEFLESLPNDLTVLEVINCPSFSTEVLGNYLTSHGQRLKKLVLNHNHALDLTWLANLKKSSPSLQILRMDLTYYSTALLTQNADAEPVFDALLTPADVPSWPESLVELELLNLRKWTSEAAVTFFESILSSSQKLTRLRKLVIRAMIDISWRERAGFREKWIGRLKNALLYRAPPPNPHLASFRVHREWKQATERQEAEEKEKQEGRKDETERRQTRSAQHAQDDEDDGLVESKEDGYGFCEVVDVNIDNMRLTEKRLTEADFIDSEISGDEEWTGERSSPGPASYAW